jgi:integrase
MTLTHYAAPLRNLSVDAIATGDVLGVVKPIWHSKPETASRLRGRIERVLDAAKAEGLRRGDNPARWRGNLKALLPERDASARKHHAAMAYADLPAFMVRLRDRRATAALALEFTILTAARTNETLGARWPELDLEGATWTIPKERMKAKRAHRVPLSARAVEILAMLYAARAGEFVFPGYKPRRPLSGMSMEMLLRRMGFPPKSVTVHGFRSTFRDWASETTGFPNDVCEMALAHTIKNKAEAAYRRGDLLDKRRELMDAWAAHCMP